MLPLVILTILLIIVFLAVCAVLGFTAFIRQNRGPSCESELIVRIRRLEKRVMRLERKPETPADAGADLNQTAGEVPVTPQIPQQDLPESTGKTGLETPDESVGAASDATKGKPRHKGSLWTGLEKAVGERWIAWAGAIVIFFAVGFFLKHAIDMGWIDPAARCTLGVFAGIIMVFAGDLCLRRHMRGLGQGLVGGGLAVLYVSIFAAFSFYDLLPQELAFGIMTAVTAAGMLLAVLHDALPIAFISMTGGLLTPVLCATGQDRRDVLFAYMAVLNLGVLGVALFKRWRALDVMAFAGTWLLFAGWYGRFYTAAALVPTMSWLLVFFMIFLLLPFAYHLRTGRAVPLERFIMSMLHAVVAFGFSFAILYPDKQHWLGFVAIGMAASYSALGKAMFSRGGGARTLLGFITLGMIFLVMAVPLHVGLHGTLIVWVALSVALLYLGYQFDYLPVRLGAFVVFCVATARFFAVHRPLHVMDFTLFWNISFATALCLPLGGALFFLIHRRFKERSGIPDRVTERAVCAGSCLLMLLILHSEIGPWLILRGGAPNGFDGNYFAQFARSLIWTLGSAMILFAGVRWRSFTVRLVAIFPLAAGLLFAYLFYTKNLPDQVLFINLRFVAALAGALAVFFRGHALCRKGRKWERKQGYVFYWLGIFFLLTFLSMEAWTFSGSLAQTRAQARWAGLMSLSITWGVYAIALLATGFWRRLRSLRLVALALFGITGLKLVLVDMAGVEEIYRIVSFLAIGILMIGASYIYHKVEQKINRAEEV